MLFTSYCSGALDFLLDDVIYLVTRRMSVDDGETSGRHFVERFSRMEQWQMMEVMICNGMLSDNGSDRRNLNNINGVGS